MTLTPPTYYPAYNGQSSSPDCNLLKCQKWSPYKRRKWFLHLRKERKCKPSHSIASQNSRHVHGVLCVCFPPPSSLPSCSFLLVQDLSSKWIVLTDNVTKIAWQVYSSLMPSPTRTSWWETVWRTKSNFLDLFPKCGKEGLIRLWYYVALPLQQLISTWVSVCTFFERVGVNCFQCC